MSLIPELSFLYELLENVFCSTPTPLVALFSPSNFPSFEAICSHYIFDFMASIKDLLNPDLDTQDSQPPVAFKASVPEYRNTYLPELSQPYLPGPPREFYPELHRPRFTQFSRSPFAVYTRLNTAPSPNTASNTQKKAKMPKDSPVFRPGNTVGEVRYPPCEERDEELARIHREFRLHPMGEIAKFPRHIPYQSDKKSFQEKTGRDSFHGTSLLMSLLPNTIADII
jgi:hypothetical protein